MRIVSGTEELHQHDGHCDQSDDEKCSTLVLLRVDMQKRY